MTMVPDAPSLDRAIASGTAFERPLPGSAAASSLGLSQSQQQRQPAGSTKTVKKGVKDLPTGYGAGAAAGPGLSFRVCPAAPLSRRPPPLWHPALPAEVSTPARPAVD